ncbi:MAG: hypothetical protein ACTSRC_09735 [Candidatus Helarchaeota archaeon]
MDLTELKSRVKQIALDGGAKLAGIGSADRLKDAPPSADMTYCLSGAQSCKISRNWQCRPVEGRTPVRRHDVLLARSTMKWRSLSSKIRNTKLFH